MLKLQGIALGWLALSTVAFAVTPQDAPGRYVRAGERGAELYNLPSRDGVVIENVAAGTPLAVYGERAGFIDVELPGGMRVWVYGEYTRETGVPGLLEIDGNNLTMRPLPSSSTQSFPLKQKLHRGDRVRMIRRADPDKPLSQDWVQIWSPPGTRAWVRATSTEEIPSGEDSKALWATAVATAVATRPVPAPQVEATSAASVARSASPSPSSTQAAAAGATQASVEAREALAEADFVFQNAKTGTGTLAESRAAYERVIELAPTSSSEAAIARTRLEEVAAREELQRLQTDVESYNEARLAEIERAEADLVAVRAKNDPLWGGQFQARGWLERAQRPDGSEVMVVRWSGDETAEVVCRSGRYDLSVFENFEVGIRGVTVAAPVAQDIGQFSRPVRLEVASIEVISGRRTKR